MEEISRDIHALREDHDELLRLVKKMNGRQRDILIELGGVPDDIGRKVTRSSIRDRLHAMENDQSTAIAARAAVSASQSLYAASSDRRFSRREKLAGIVLALIVAVGPYITLIIHTQ